MECKILVLFAPPLAKNLIKKLANENRYHLPPGSRLAQGAGFQSFTVPEVRILQPQKKPCGQALFVMAQHANQWLATLRIQWNVPLAE